MKSFFLFLLLFVSTLNFRAQTCSIDITTVNYLGSGYFQLSTSVVGYNLATSRIDWNYYDVNNYNNNANPTIQFQYNGNYSIIVVLSDSITGCISSDTVNVIVNDLSTLCNTTIYPISFVTFTNNPLYYEFQTYYSFTSNATTKNLNWRVKQGGIVINESAIQNATSGNSYYNTTFPASGNFDVTFILSSSIVGCSDSLTININVGNGNCNVVSSFTYNQIGNSFGYNFISNQSNPSTTTYGWSFDYPFEYFGIPIQSAPNTSYSFTNSGLHNAYHYAQDSIPNGYCIDTSSAIINVNACQAYYSFLMDSMTGIVDITSHSSSALGSPNSYWDMGDGTIIPYTNNQNLSYSYSTPGIYTICFHTDNGLGCLSSLCNQVLFSSIECFAYFSSQIDTLNGINYLYDSSFVSPIGANCYWDMGDGTTYTYLPNQTIVHNYAASGLYNVCLIVSNGSSCNDTFCLNINSFRQINNNKVNLTGLNQTIINPQFIGYSENIINTSEIILYPNPTINNLKIDLKENFNFITIKIYNLIGKQISISTYANTNSININAEKFSNGIYFIEIINGNQLIKSAKFIKE